MKLNPIISALNSPRQNHVLAALPPVEYERLLPHLELVPLALGQVLYEAGDQQRYAYFLTTSIVSNVYPLGDALSQELAIVGNCGVVGYVLVTGGESATHRAVVLSAGYAYKLSSDVLKTEFERGSALHQQLLLYTQALIVQISQTVACNQYHTIDQQLCRWLLLSLDRMPMSELTLTQEHIANMLGVRHEGLAAVAGHLQAVGLTECSHSKITELDRPKLEARVCECYAVVKREYERLLPGMDKH
jgi:CRP-like cAMP-binding protein